MYKGSGPIVPVVAGAATLPVTGMSNAASIALAVAAGLAVWAIVYAVKFSNR